MMSKNFGDILSPSVGVAEVFLCRAAFSLSVEFIFINVFIYLGHFLLLLVLQ